MDEDDELYDLAVRTAREFSMRAVETLASIMMDRDAPHADRIAAAEAILEVSGCLSH